MSLRMKFEILSPKERERSGLGLVIIGARCVRSLFRVEVGFSEVVTALNSGAISLSFRFLMSLRDIVES